MSIQDWGAIGEIIGGVGVIVTLLYLAAQIRQNTKQVASASLQALSSRVEARMMANATNAEFAELLQRWRDGEELTEVELSRANSWFGSWVSDLQDGYRQFKLGLVSEGVLKGRIYTVMQLIGTSHGRENWKMLREIVDPEFRDWLEGKIDHVEST